MYRHNVMLYRINSVMLYRTVSENMSGLSGATCKCGNFNIGAQSESQCDFFALFHTVNPM